MKCHCIYNKCHLRELFVVVIYLAESEISFENCFIKKIACFLKIEIKQAQTDIFKKIIKPTVVAVSMYLPSVGS